MPVPQDHRGIKGDECQCGRRASIRHCPSCGSSRIHALKAEYEPVEGHTTNKGEPLYRKLQEFKCISCAHIFEESDREFCEAPPVSKVLAQQKVKAIREASKTGEYLNSQDQKLASAISELLPTETSQASPTELRELNATELKNTWFALRRAWVDMSIEAKTKHTTCPTLLDFLKEKLPLCMNQEQTELVLKWQAEEIRDSNG